MHLAICLQYRLQQRQVQLDLVQFRFVGGLALLGEATRTFAVFLDMFTKGLGVVSVKENEENTATRGS